jgi:hypothetical protein
MHILIYVYVYVYTCIYIYIYICTHVRNGQWKHDDCAQAAASESFGIKVWIARVVGVGLQTHTPRFNGYFALAAEEAIQNGVFSRLH